MPQRTKSSIRDITLGSSGLREGQTLLSRDRIAALKDLKAHSVFHPEGDENGPYDLALSVQENRLIFEIGNDHAPNISTLALSLKPYKRLIKDYFIIVDSFEKAKREGHLSRIEAIDMGRRGLHNEGADLLIERLRGKITMDHDTARRLFTLICVLHVNSSLAWR